MTKYVALLRGIGPSNPNMHGAKLKEVMDGLGFKNVQTLISSGNVLFESSSKDPAKLEAKLEAAWPEKLGFSSITIIRSQPQLQALLAADPFKGVEHSRQSYQLVTFFKSLPSPQPKGQFYTVQGVNAVCTTLDTTTAKTPDFMARLDKQFSKQITSRTYKTVQRILQKMD
jgi:uncharacterized protein (DUF1697 family)